MHNRLAKPWNSLPWGAITSLLFLAIAAKAAAAERQLVIADFEDGTRRPFGNGTVVADHATHGGKALLVEGKKWCAAGNGAGLPRDWSLHDLVTLDLFNPHDKPIKFSLMLRDTMNRGYWSWHDRYTALAPGKNTVQFAIADLWRGEVLRRDIGGFLDPKNITLLSLHCEESFYLDYLRLEPLPVAKVKVPGLKAFDVGKEGTPGFGGFTRLTQNDSYDKERGYGWTKADFARMDDRIHPDNLFRDNLSCRDAELAIDLPNGTYRVHLQLNDPGYWEYMQNFRHRAVTAEGRKVVDEGMSAEDFLDRYFLNQDAEDFPGDDPFEKYVQPRFPWHVCEVEVTDGQLNLGFRSDDSYGNTLSALVIYPAKEAAAATVFFEYVKTMRKLDWSQRWKAAAPDLVEPEFTGRLAEEAGKNGFVLFRSSIGADLGYSFVPREDDAVEALTVTASPGEFEPFLIGMKPARSLGKVELEVSDLKGAAGAIIAGKEYEVRVGRYRFARYQGQQTGLYTIVERELRQFNRTEADTLVADNFAARRFWITVHVPAEAKAGVYKGTATIKAESGGSRSVELSLRVLPVQLPEPDFPFTLYGIMALPMPYYPEMKAREFDDLSTVYVGLRNHGINYLKNLPVSIQWRNGKAEIGNVEFVDRILRLQKKLGFRPGPVDVASGCSARDLAYSSSINGVKKKDFILNYHKRLTNLFAEKGWPHPYFSFGDEPTVPETLRTLAVAHTMLHMVDDNLWTGIAYHMQDTPECRDMAATVDVQEFKAFCPPADFRRVRDGAKLLLASNVGRDRHAYGLWSWRARRERRIDGVVTFSYTGSHVDLYYGLDAREDEFQLASPRRDGSLTTTAMYERIREGIEDFRYARLLETLAEDEGTPAGKTARIKVLLDEAYRIGGMDRRSFQPAGKKPGEDNRVLLAEWRRGVHEVLSQNSPYVKLNIK